MAACTFRVGTADTGATPNTSGAFTPAVNDLLIVFVVATGAVGAGDSLTSSVGITFSKITNALFNTSADSVYAYVANSLVTAGQAVSQTIDYDNTDAATGTIIFVYSVSGMTRTGASAIRQSRVISNAGAGGFPGVNGFSSNFLTTNPTLGCFGCGTNPPTVTPPSGWTEPAGGDIGYATPTTGGAVCHRDSGSTGTAFTWGTTVASANGALGVELDSSVPLKLTPPFIANQQAIRRASFY